MFILHLPRNPTVLLLHTPSRTAFFSLLKGNNLFLLCQPLFIDFFVVFVELVLLVVVLLVMVLLVMVLLVMVLLVLPCGRIVNNHKSPSTAML